MKNILITGGAGFIGSHVVRLFVNKYPDYKIVNLDKLTYAGNLANLKDIEDKPNYKFIKGDISDLEEMRRIIRDNGITGIIHLAAESHVDRSIKDPFTFARTNVMGTLALLQAAKEYWESLPERYEGKLFYHISTDEVYGALNSQIRKASNRRSAQQPLPSIIMPTAQISSLRRQSIIHILHIRHQRLRATISFVRITTHTGCRHLLPTVPTITVRISSPKSLFLFS